MVLDTDERKALHVNAKAEAMYQKNWTSWEKTYVINPDDPWTVQTRADTGQNSSQPIAHYPTKVLTPLFLPSFVGEERLEHHIQRSYSRRDLILVDSYSRRLRWLGLFSLCTQAHS